MPLHHYASFAHIQAGCGSTRDFAESFRVSRRHHDSAVALSFSRKNTSIIYQFSGFAMPLTPDMLREGSRKLGRLPVFPKRSEHHLALALRRESPGGRIPVEVCRERIAFGARGNHRQRLERGYLAGLKS